ncbi:PqqD family peptide modification chaperone [Microbacterium sp. 5K110]|uniref:PqqD family peptide modification chaperone n=1 Tax=unclassified Microbacterium TaxID=2609290 RepID=UPI0010FD2DD7|nr:PqqD family peptide modification chaperone [Microbacterium sp. 5K110]TLF28370.1 hypothetical protein FE256_14400 [Microbacterium sp. 5K110]
MIAAVWRDCLVPTGVGGPLRTLGVSETMFDDLARGLSDLSTRVTLAALDALRGTRLLLHAAGVTADDGRVLALVGPSGRGKTTAATHLGRHFGYVSDESVAVDLDLAVWPYRKPLSVIVDGKPFKQQIAPSDLGLRPLPDAPLRLAGITLLERQPDTDDPGVRTVDLVDAICELTPQISYLPELPSPLQYIARIVDQVGAVTRLVYRDAAELPAMVTAMFASRPAAAQEWSVAPRPAQTGPWRCAEVDDAILVEGRACILRDGVVTALDHRGCLVWRMCLEGATSEQITAAAITAFGAPADGAAEELIAETLDDLRTHGFVSPA